MKNYLDEIKEQIIEKNQQLKSFENNNMENIEKKQKVGLELDRLLYRYFKSLARVSYEA